MAVGQYVSWERDQHFSKHPVSFSRDGRLTVFWIPKWPTHVGFTSKIFEVERGLSFGPRHTCLLVRLTVMSLGKTLPCSSLSSCFDNYFDFGVGRVLLITLSLEKMCYENFGVINGAQGERSENTKVK